MFHAGGRTEGQTKITKLSLLQFCERAYKGPELGKGSGYEADMTSKTYIQHRPLFLCTLYVSNTMQATLRVFPHPILKTDHFVFQPSYQYSCTPCLNITPLQHAKEPAEMCAKCNWNSLKSRARQSHYWPGQAQRLPGS